MPNFLSSAGYAIEGADKGSQVQQQSDLDAQRIEQAKQATATGQLGLDTLRRTTDTQTAVRNAGANAINQGKTFSGSLLDMSVAAAQKGDMQSALQYRQAFGQLEDMGAKDVVHSALTDPRPGDRPDLVQVMHQYEKTKDTTGASLDDAGNLTISRTSGPPTTLNVGKLGELMGMVAPPKIQTIPAGGRGVITQPGKAPIYVDTPKTFHEPPKEGYVVKTSKDADGNETQHIIDIRPGSPSYGQEVAPGTAGMGGTGGPNVRKDLPVLNDITKGITELGDEYGKTDMTNPLNPKITLTPKGQQVALVAEQIRMANQSLAPRTIIDMAIKGKPMWKVEDGKRTGVVLYNGQEYAMNTPMTGKPIAKPAPAAPAVPAPAPHPAPATAAPAATPVAAEVPAETVPEVPGKPRAVKNAFSFSGVQEDTGARAEFDKKRAADKLRSTYTLLMGATGQSGKLYSPIDIQNLQNVIKAGVLTDAEKAKANALLARSGSKAFAKGGKVSRMQCHGLG